MKQANYSKKRVYIILAIMICVQLISIICYFQFWKEGFHSDEIWSYGYANSYYLQHIYQDEQGDLTYVGDWYDTDVLRDYIVVNEGEQFAYDSIYHNQIYDFSPPFHSMLLHTICSFFPEQFSSWFSFSINIISFVLTMIYLFKLASFMKNDIFALCCCTLYGFSMGARDTYIYLRMYALCTALIMMMLYHTLKYISIYKKNKKLLQKHLIVIGIVSLLGFLTHYYVVSFIGILTFFICLFCFLKKDYKLAFAFGFFMLAIFLVSVLIFPSMFQMAEGKASEAVAVMDYNFKIRMQMLSHLILLKLFNIKLSIYPSGIVPIVFGVLVFLLIVFVPILYLLRNTSGMKWFVKYSKMILLHPRRTIRYALRRINWWYVILFFTVVGQMAVVGELSNIYVMKALVDRYLFYVLPIVTIIGLALIYQVTLMLVRKRRYAQYLLIVASILLAGINIYNCTRYTDYAFLRGNKVNIENVIAEKDCIYLRNDVWMLTTMVPTLMCADEFSLLQYKDYKDIRHLYEKKKNQEVIVIIDSSFKQSVEQMVSDNSIDVMVEGKSREDEVNKLYNDIITFLEDLEPDTKMKHLTTQVIFTRDMEVYLVNP